MADFVFESLVERLFGEPPEFADAPLFAARVELRLNRSWSLRGVLIGGLGLAGGVLGGVQVLSSGLADRLAVITHHSREVAEARLEAVAGSLLLPGGVTITPELAAMSMVLVAVAAGIGMMRLLRDV